MDLWSVHLKNSSNWAPFLLTNSIPEKPISALNLRSMMMGSSSGNCGILEIKVPKRKSFVVAATGKKSNNNSNSDNFDSSSGNDNQSSVEGNNQKENNPFGDKKEKDNESQKPNRNPLDWREFRASLYIQEQAEIALSDSHNVDETAMVPKSLPLKWAHPISAPENGCLLVARETLDGVRAFERTVVLLLRCGTRHPEDRSYGIVINRPLDKKIKHMKPSNFDLQTTFSECSLYYGGPLEASMYLMRTGGCSFHGFEDVIPGISYGYRNSLDEASTLVKKSVLKPQDFRFFVGYAGWTNHQLSEELESNYWYVASCSANLIFGNSSSEGLWEEILQLMGGQYSELSRKPKQDI